MHNLKFLNVFGAIVILFLTGVFGYFLGARTSRAPVVVEQGQSDSTTQDLSNALNSSSSADIAGVLGGILNWRVEQATDKTLRCADGGMVTSAEAKIIHLGIGPVNPQENTVQQAVSDIRAALAKDKWATCQPATVGPTVQETYRKSGQLFELQANYSMGTGNTLDLYFEYQ